MSVILQTTAEADASIRVTATWWRANRPSAPFLFEDELARALSVILESPEVGRRFRRKSIPGLRRILLAVARYHVYYVYDARQERILILDVWSAVRGRGPRLKAP